MTRINAEPVRTLSTAAAWLAAVNLPFVIGHPLWAVGLPPLARSLAINLVLFAAPGLWIACRFPRGSGFQTVLLGTVAAAMVVFIALLAVLQMTGQPDSPASMWNATWAASNLLLAGSLIWRRSPQQTRSDTPEPAETSPPRSTAWCVSGLLFAAAYGLYFYGATGVVPEQADHDLEVQGTGHALLDRMEPLLLTDRGTHYYFAHPLLLHFYVAESFLYFDAVDHLRPFDEASQRARAARLREPFTPVDLPVGDYRVVGVAGADYLRSPGGGTARIPIDLFELELIDSHYAREPHRLETRTPTIFLASATVALVGWWSVHISRRWWLGLLVGAAYATGPEVFVRSSYGGYFGISNFAALLMLMAANDRILHEKSRGAWWSCVLAGVFAALANHKLVLLPAALCLAIVRHSRGGPGRRRLVELHPAFVGFAAGTAVFWLYGLLIDAGSFWHEHLRTHLVDRLAHVNPLGYTGYATAGGLWAEFSAHTGYGLLPLGAAAMLLALAPGNVCERGGLPCGTLRSWLAWCVLMAIVFTAVDWRMTKHLTPMLLPLHLAPVAWTSLGRVPRGIVAIAFVGLLAWNVWTLTSVVSNFSAFPITPAW